MHAPTESPRITPPVKIPIIAAVDTADEVAVEPRLGGAVCSVTTFYHGNNG